MRYKYKCVGCGEEFPVLTERKCVSVQLNIAVHLTMDFQFSHNKTDKKLRLCEECLFVLVRDKINSM